MIGVVKAIQLITNEFKFNSYIISVLVIFFLQMNYGVPTTINLDNNYTKTKKELQYLLYGFFQFYADKYQHASHIISARFGRWQQRKWNPAHKIFDDEQKKYSHLTLYVQAMSNAFFPRFVQVERCY